MVDINGMVYCGNILWYYISTYHAYLLYKSVQKILKTTVELFNYYIFNYYQQLLASKK